MAGTKENYNYQKIITIVGVILFIVKIVAWYITGSVAIYTDALESVANVCAAFVGLYSLYLSSIPKDANHPYGHGKAEFVSAAIEGTLIAVAGIVIIGEVVHNFTHPHVLGKLDTGILLVGATAAVNYIMGTIAIRKGRNSNSMALVASGKHLLSDTYSTVGIIAGLIVIYFTHLGLLDNLIAILFAVIIVVTGYRIIRSSLAGIMDEADTELLKKIVSLLEQHRQENWIDMHNLRIIKYGPTLHLDCHLTVPWYLTVQEGHEEMERLQTLIRNNFGDSVEMFIHTDPCVEFSCNICSKPDCKVRQHPFEKRIEWTIENISINRKHDLQSR